MRNHSPYGDEARPLSSKLFHLIYLLLIIFAVTPAVAQTSGQITGRVTDATGQGLPGVTVRIKESTGTTGAVTDVNGRYRIAAASGNTLVFSFIGFTPQEIRVADQEVIDVQMRDDARSLNEVVVIGYQSVRKRDLTGAVSSISPTEANRVSANNVAESLQGLSPGVTVRSSGAPGQNSQIEIRGVASFINASPLYVIDGMIADANSTVNNDDVESIQILKDASAAAIYGSRAANGVVIITTKKGKKGAPKINFTAKYGQQRIPKQWDVMNSTQYAATKSQAYTNSGLPVPASIGSAFNTAVNTDWQDLDQRTGNNQDYNLSVSGGSDNSTYLISGSYFRNQGVLKAYSFDRASLRINTETKKGRLTFGENAMLSNSNNYHPNRGNPFYDLPQLLPTVPVQSNGFITNNNVNPMGYSTGTADNGGDVTYAYNSLAVNDLSQGYNNYAKILGNAFAQFRVFDWLDYKFNVGLEASFDYNRDFRKNGIFSYAQQPELSYIDQDRERFRNILLEHTLNFNKTFGVHNINGVVGFSEQSSYRDLTSARKTNLTVLSTGEYLTEINSAGGAPSVSGRVAQDDRIRSYLGRLNYTYNDKYLLTASGRIDQDSRFGPNYRSGFFPSVAVAWRLSKEDFFKADWVDNLKINASYGVLGINTINSYQNIGLINNSPRAIFAGDAIFGGAYQSTLYNADLRWEKRKETNIGFDASLFHDRLSVSASVYNNKSEDVLVNQVLGQFLGNAGGNPPVNAASISNKGIEVEATYRNNNNAFKWSVSGNVTTIKNKVLALGNQGVGVNYIQQGSTRSQIGYALGQWYVLKEVGIFQTQDEINNYKRADGSPIEPFAKPGDVKFYADPNGKGTINNNDRVFNGSPWPTLQTGLQFNASYKQFNVNLQLVGIFGLTIYNDIRRILDGYQNSNFRADINPWTPTNTSTTDPRLGIANGDPGIANNNTPESSRWLENGSYGRIRNLEIGYTFGKAALKPLHVENARIFISGQNLLTVTKYKGLDPDLVGNGLLQRGVDAGNWPANRIYSVGVSFGF
ncbi:TonB-dependent receptor [Mucilaginibacter terrenus]|uniref:TonB-dependent receptor n=2 Tax=Mucilaginibacter terrenus TaxID=2482727 RepID=A0A3E2NYJ4_9SPHI|nr:TonB-dependent receptor [Mucilaginibacter terrenus]